MVNPFASGDENLEDDAWRPQWTSSTTHSKSRVNFLKLLRVPYEEYVLDEDALEYMKPTFRTCGPQFLLIVFQPYWLGKGAETR